MTPVRIGPRLTVLCWLVLTGSVFADQAADEATYRDTLLPLLRTYCFDCHGSGDEISSADDGSASAMQKNRKRWVQALTMVRLKSMPPEDGERLDERHAGSWLI